MLTWFIVKLEKRLCMLSFEASLRAGRRLGRFLGSVLRLRRSEIERSLKRCFPEKSPGEIRQILDESYESLGITAIEFARLASIDQDYVDKYVEIENGHFFFDALRKKKGVIILTAHTSNFILLCITARIFNVPLHVISKRIKPVSLQAHWDRVYEKFGVKTLDRRNSYRDCARVLKRGEALGFVLDQNMKRRHGIFVDFFGRPACTSPGLAHMSSLCGSPVLPVFMQRKSDGRHRIVVMKPLDPPPDRKESTIREATQQYTALIEQVVRGNPGQWIWLHRRWRTRPELDREPASEGSGEQAHH